MTVSLRRVGGVEERRRERPGVASFVAVGGDPLVDLKDFHPTPPVLSGEGIGGDPPGKVAEHHRWCGSARESHRRTALYAAETVGEVLGAAPSGLISGVGDVKMAAW